MTADQVVSISANAGGTVTLYLGGGGGERTALAGVDWLWNSRTARHWGWSSGRAARPRSSCQWGVLGPVGWRCGYVEAAVLSWSGRGDRSQHTRPERPPGVRGLLPFAVTHGRVRQTCAFHGQLSPLCLLILRLPFTLRTHPGAQGQAVGKGSGPCQDRGQRAWQAGSAFLEVRPRGAETGVSEHK